MDQTLLDSSKYRIFALSLDSRFADQINGGTEDFSIKMPSTYKNIQRIAVTSTEIPMVEYLISERKGNTSFSLQIGVGPRVDIVIPDGNYDAPAFALAIQTALKAVDAGFTCSANLSNGLLIINHSTTLFNVLLTSADINISNRRSDWGIGYNMGFRTKGIIQAYADIVNGGYSVNGSTVVLIQPVPYYLLQLECPDLLENITHRVASGASVPAFAKLVLVNEVYNIQFNNAADYINNMYTFLTPINISNIRLRLLDCYGELVDMKCLDWAATIQLFQIVNSKTYNSISDGFNR